MTYKDDYIEGFRSFAGNALTSDLPVDVFIDQQGMRAYVRNHKNETNILADPPFFGYVDRLIDDKLVHREMCETADQYAVQIAEACQWAEESSVDRSVKADRLSYTKAHYDKKE